MKLHVVARIRFAMVVAMVLLYQSAAAQYGGGGAADLVLISVNAPDSGSPQDPFGVQVVIQNVGNQASGNYTVTFYLSTDSNITPSDHNLGTESRPSLAAGQITDFVSTHTVMATVDTGEYYVGAIITGDDPNKTNNVNHDPNPTSVVHPGGNAFQINYGLNDTWFNPATSGQGFFITVFPDIQKMFLAWFTYDVTRPPGSLTAQLGEPGHRWLTAFGDYAGDTATLNIEITEGGVFDSAAPATTQGPDGTITVTFTDCNTGEVSYNIPSVSQSGVVPIERIALDNVSMCEAEQNP